MLFKSLMYPYHRKKLNQKSKDGKLCQIFIEKDAQFKPSQYNNFFDSLYTVYRASKPHEWMSFEFYGSTKGIGLYSWLSGGIPMDFLQSNINSVHPSAEVYKCDQPYTDFGRWHEANVSGAVLELDGHFLFNTLQSDGERVGADLMASLCASLGNLDDKEEVAVQFLLRPIGHRSLKIANAHFELYKRYGRRPSKLHYPYARYNPYLEVPKAIVGAVQHTMIGSAGAQETHHSMTSIQKKLEAGVYFDVLIRIVTAHPNGKSLNRLNTVISAFAPATDKNRLRPHTCSRKEHERFLKEFEDRRIHTYPIENYMTPPELATMLHFPSADIPGVIRLRAKKLPVPEGVHQYNTMEEAWKDGAIVFGRSNFRGRQKYLAFKDLKMLMQHLYCIGGTGSGKSYWLSLIALQVAKHTGLTFFDVKGDIIDDFMRHLPKSEWHRVVYIDLHAKEYFIPFNILRQPGTDTYDLATMIVSTFVKCFSEGSIKEHSQNVLRQALIAVISSDPEGSILEVYRMFTDENYLDTTIARLEARNEYPDVLNYWKNIFKPMKASGRKGECGAITNKLQAITQNKRPRYTLCQKKNSLDWRKLMDSKSIILVNLSMGQNEPEILTFFGTLFTSFISKATFSRDDTHRDKRVPHFFIIDEFERFIHQAEDMQKFLEMARSYGLGLGLAHQNMAQITNKSLLGTIKDNTFTQVSLLIGQDSASEVSRMFPEASPEDLQGMTEFTGFGRLKKLSPKTFTFDAPDMGDYFEVAEWEEVEAWKEEYRKTHYEHLYSIKEEIDARYVLVEKNQVHDSDSPAVRKGKASGRLTRRGVAIANK